MTATFMNHGGHRGSQRGNCKLRIADCKFSIFNFQLAISNLSVSSVTSVVGHSSSRRGFTLLEVILALSLAVGVMGLIAMAINLHANATLNGRAQVAQAQLARAILNQISGDVRAALPPFQQDFSGALGAAADAAGDLGGTGNGGGDSEGNAGGNNSQNGTSGQGTNNSPSGTGGTNNSPSGSGNKSSGTGGGTGGGPNSASGGAASGESDSGSASGASTTSTADLPLLLGTAYELQLDVSRLPRVDQYESMMSAGGGTLADIPSDVKTVAYYVANVDAAQAGGVSEVSPGGATTALVRRSLDRAITRFASQSGDIGGLDTAAEVLATEVVAVQFAYFDGTTWLSEWDSQSMQSLPLAIEILLTIATRTDGNAAQTVVASLAGESADNVIETTFRHVVHLRGSETTAGGSGASSGTATESTADTGASPMGGTQP